ncbi:hypothetical protein [Leptospirillum ferriphilum]|uniref:Uncharacterized protein n=1 Tax=Leptospirillum ferriphilum (strain ML-04) TaxID=1048260 RepID=J9Z9M5_LEPFM|nr:hypothetical protein [Leptospirillum ferriphilum]AFS52836.1 hypothetical protein LFML04_0600 [Leptospirillum ferriphilum ML-04]
MKKKFIVVIDSDVAGVFWKRTAKKAVQAALDLWCDLGKLGHMAEIRGFVIDITESDMLETMIFNALSGKIDIEESFIVTS